jgi:propanol-preferring alcohol dehydrogenase
MLVPHARHLVSLGTCIPTTLPRWRCGVTPWRAVQRASAWLQPGARVLLIGFGGLGQFALQYLAASPS